LTSDDDVSRLSRGSVKSSRYDDEDVPGVGDADAKSLDDDDDYYTYDDDTDDDDKYGGGGGEYKARPESRSYYPEPHYYPEQEYDEPQYYYQPRYPKKKKKKVYVPVFVPEKEKKKS